MMCVLKVSVLFYTCSDDLSLVSHSPVPTIGVQPPHQHLQLSKRIEHCERLRVKVAEFVLFSRALRIGIQAPRGSKAGLKSSEWPPSSRLSLSSCCLSRVYLAALLGNAPFHLKAGERCCDSSSYGSDGTGTLMSICRCSL